MRAALALTVNALILLLGPIWRGSAHAAGCGAAGGAEIIAGVKAIPFNLDAGQSLSVTSGGSVTVPASPADSAMPAGGITNAGTIIGASADGISIVCYDGTFLQLWIAGRADW